MVSKKLNNIIEALGKHQDTDSVRVLNEIGTNCANDEVRELPRGKKSGFYSINNKRT